MSATDFKNEGNQAFSAGKYTEAITSFSSAIRLDSSNHVLFSNRSACHAALHKYADALEDAEKCVQLKPDWAKGYVRKGAALHGLRRYHDAIAAYQKGLEVEDSNQSCIQGIADVQKAMTEEARNPFSKAFSPDAFQKIQENPKLSLLLLQPDYVKMIDTVVKDPSKASLFLKDQRFLMTYMMLSGIKLPTDDEEDEKAPEPAKAQPKKEEKPCDPLTDEQKEALSLKEEGNKCYKTRRFDEALQKYRAAFEKDPQNTLYLLNETAVYFEMGDFTKCIDACEAALDHGREKKCDYTIISKLMTRQALCLQKLKRHTEAIELFKRALVEWRNPDTLAKLTACEKEKQKLEIEAYVDPEIAKEKKEEGNALFKEDKFPEAVAAYTEAIKRDPSEHTTYSNRAAAYLKLGAYSEALKDAEKCIELKPDFVKGYSRKGHAYFWTKQYNQALQAYDQGLKLDPTNADCKDGRVRTLLRIQEMATGQAGADSEEAARRAMADPEIAAIMQDSYMQLVLSEMQKDPTRIQDYLRDPNISEKINKLIASGIIRFGN